MLVVEALDCGRGLLRAEWEVFERERECGRDFWDGWTGGPSDVKASQLEI